MPLDIEITQNVSLGDSATNDDTSTVGEPSVAVNAEKVFVTGNWYASRSSDSSASWTWVDPANTLPTAAGGFCCDQLTLYDAQRRIWIWILQYSRQNGTNVFRIAIKRDADFSSGSGWYWWDIAPATLNGAWTNVWFDYPDAALSADNLYVSFNVFDNSSPRPMWQRASVMRFPLDTLANGGSLGFDWWSTTNNGSIRFTQQAIPTGSMYFGSHNSGDELRLFSWPDSGNSITFWDVDVRAWGGTISSTAPNGVDWLARADSRITAGCLGNGVITFMWTAGADTNRPQPYCRVVRINENTKNVIDEPDIWSTTRAWAYPAACVNASGVVGFAAFYGGGDRNPGHIVGARDETAGTWRTSYSRLGSHSPTRAAWGDYMNCRADIPLTSGWVASGYTLEGGSGRQSILPRVVRFRLKDTTPVGAQSWLEPVLGLLMD